VWPVKSIRKSELRPVPWKTSDVILGLGLVVVSVLVVVFIYRALGEDPGSGLGLAVIGGTTYGIVLLASWLMGPVRYGASLRSLGFRLPTPRGYLQLLLPLLVLGASLAFTGVYARLVSLLGWEMPRTLPKEFVLEGPALIGSFAVVVLWGPLAEEVFFRGFIFSGLTGRYGFARAAVASSLLFALAHGALEVIAPIFVTGMLLAWLYHRTGSLWGCVGAHALQNALVFSITVGA